jgi:anti-sigma B factor antagonist
MGPQLTFTVHPNGQGVLLRVGGEVDLATSPQLHAKLVDLVEVGEASSVVVDLTPVAFMDSTGLGVLLAAHKRARANGGRVLFVCPEGPVLRVLRLTGMDKVLSIHGSLAEAMAAQDAHADAH